MARCWGLCLAILLLFAGWAASLKNSSDGQELIGHGQDEETLEIREGERPPNGSLAAKDSDLVWRESARIDGTVPTDAIPAEISTGPHGARAETNDSGEWSTKMQVRSKVLEALWTAGDEDRTLGGSATTLPPSGTVTESREQKNLSQSKVFQELQKQWDEEFEDEDLGVRRPTVQSSRVFQELQRQWVEETDYDVFTTPPTTTVSPYERAVKFWEDAEKYMFLLVSMGVNYVTPIFHGIASDIHISNDCETGIMRVMFALRRLEQWAVEMVDAFGKPPAGMLRGTVTSFGAFDECVNIVAKSENGRSEYFRGKYCTVEIRPPLPPKPQQYTIYEPLQVLANFSRHGNNVVRHAAKMAHAFYFLSYRVDVCVPSTCTQEDVNNLAQLASKYIDVNITVPRCAIKEELELNNAQIGILCIVALLLLFGCFGTFVDILREIFIRSKRIRTCLNNKLTKVILAFSVNSNAKLLLDTDVPQNGLGSLHGMRFFTMGWIIMGHTFLYTNIQIYSDLQEANGYVESFFFQFIINSTVSIDTFFFISGVMLAYLTLQYMDKYGNFSIPRFFARRLVRLTPPYMMVIALTFLMPMLGSGPFWHETVDPVVRTCRTNWWTNLLYINNFVVTPGERCLEHSWYLSCDFQLYIMSLMVLLPMARWPVIGLSINFFLVAASIIITGFLTHYYNFPPTILVTYPDPQDRDFLHHMIFSKPYCHLGPYCIGMFIGYLFYTCPEIKLKWYQHALGWAGAIACNTAVVYGVFEWNKGNLPSTPVALAYAATHRTAWALGLAWFTFICVSGYGGIINRMLSWKVFIPLSRLTYMVYLVHPLIQFVLTGYIRERIQTNYIIATYFFFGHIMTSYALSAICYVFFDAPVMLLKKMALGENTPRAPRLSLHALADNHPSDFLDKMKKLSRQMSNGSVTSDLTETTCVHHM